MVWDRFCEDLRDRLHRVAPSGALPRQRDANFQVAVESDRAGVLERAEGAVGPLRLYSGRAGGTQRAERRVRPTVT